MGKHWLIRPCDNGHVQDLSRHARIPLVVAQLLFHRGITAAQPACAFLNSKFSDLRAPAELPGLEQAVDVVFVAVRAAKRITIYGDYDADGMTSTAILVRCLRLLGAHVSFFLPQRLTEGYGVHADAIERLAAGGTELVIAVDCGITSLTAALKAKELRLPLVILDHHEFAQELPLAAAIVHPRMPGHEYPFAGLCGAGIALKFAWALCQRASQSQRVTERLRDFLMSATGLAAIGTVADVVPLVDENRLIVRYGLNALLAQPVPGLRALLHATALRDSEQLASEDIAFSIAPRLNAVGRIGQAELGVELLTTDCADRASVLAQYVNEMNENRATIERSIYLSANKQVKEQHDLDQEPALVLSGRGWHPGVIGIVAGKLAEKYARPVVMIALDELGQRYGTGSARSAQGCDLHQALIYCSDQLISFGGHAAAAGLRIDETRLTAFREQFCRYVEQSVPPEQRRAQLYIDAESPLVQLTLQTVSQIEQLAPFGAGNPRPILCARGVVIDGEPKAMGGSGRHLSLQLRQGARSVRAVAFGRGEEWGSTMGTQCGAIDVAYRPLINQFRGRRNVELHLVDWRPAQA